MAIPAAARRWIDPDSGDYVVENGGPRGDDTRASKIVLRLRMRRGSCAVLPRFGSRLHLITANAAGSLRMAEAYAREAIADLIRSGEIRDVKITASVISESGTTALGLDVSFRDTDQDRRTARYTHRLGA